MCLDSTPEHTVYYPVFYSKLAHSIRGIRSMRFIVAITTLLLAFASVAAEAATLNVRLVPASSSITGNSDIVLNVEVRNANATSVTVPVWQVPSDDIATPVLQVTADDGTPARYVGPLIKWSPEALKAGVTFPPNSKRVFSIELSSLYDIRNGRYRIEYVQDSIGLSGFSGKIATGIAPAGPVYIQVRGRSPGVSNLRAPVPMPSGPSLTTYVCSTNQRTAISTAIGNALNYAQNAKNYFSTKGNYGAAGPRYVTWFGSTDPSRWAAVQSHYTNIFDAFNSQPVSVDCSCRKQDVYAYVYPDQPYRIYVCKAFWSAADTGTDSKAGTMVHEMSHFTIVAGTNDYAYGQTPAKRLAIRNPARAIRNADSHEYFAENTPPLN